tara:strand:+ start:500 stop:799 length:300 start_codon:yes stop_codon:yes gene_type:complete
MIPFSLLFHNLRSFNLQTELLEACEWDESKLDETIKKVTSFLDNMELPDVPCEFSYFKDKVLIPGFRKEKIEENQIKIIIKYIEHDAKFVSHILGLPEN